jgi:hypothetical protein
VGAGGESGAGRPKTREMTPIRLFVVTGWR